MSYIVLRMFENTEVGYFDLPQAIFLICYCTSAISSRLPLVGIFDVVLIEKRLNYHFIQFGPVINKRFNQALDFLKT